MKKMIFLSAVCLCCLSVFGQRPVNFGVHGGFSETKLKVSKSGVINSLKSSAKAGYMVGLFGRVNLGPVYVEPSLNYNHRESETKIDTENGVGTATVKYNSFDIPVMVGFHIVDISVVKLRVFAGPTASFTDKLKLKDFGSTLKSDNDGVMWSGKIGAGVDVWKFALDVDYEKAFKNFQKEVKGPSAFNLTLGFKII